MRPETAALGVTEVDVDSMQRPRGPARGVLIVALCVASVGASNAARVQQGAGATAAAGPTFKVVRVVSGPRGAERDGRFVVEDPRTVFSTTVDQEALVYFEWEGPAGIHRCEGVWRNPRGEVEVITRFEFEARYRRFGGYWKLPLKPGMATGLWTLEAHVDGEQAGRHLVEVVDGPAPSSTPAEPGPHEPLGAAEAYARLRRAVFAVEALDAAGDPVSAGLGFVLAGAGLVTAFQSIDGASSVRVTTPDGAVASVDRLLAWNREADVAVLPLPDGATPVLQMAAEADLHVGDRVLTLSLGADGIRTLLETNVSGLGPGSLQGERAALATPSSRGAAGAPVLDSTGEVVGVLGGVVVPGATTVRPSPSESLRDLLGYPDFGLACVPLAPVVATGQVATSFADLLRLGTFTPPLGRERRHVAAGLAAQTVQPESGWVRAVGQNTTFSKQNGQFTVLVNLSAQQRLRSSGVFRLYSRDGKPLADSRRQKVSLDAGKSAGLYWTLDPSRLTPALYRVDLLLDGSPAWRMFVEVRP